MLKIRKKRDTASSYSFSLSSLALLNRHTLSPSVIRYPNQSPLVFLFSSYPLAFLLQSQKNKSTGVLAHRQAHTLIVSLSHTLTYFQTTALTQDKTRIFCQCECVNAVAL